MVIVPRGRWDFSRFGRVVLVTFLAVLSSMTLTVAAVSFVALLFGEPVREISLAVAVVLPAFLTGPVVYYFTTKVRDLAQSHRELEIYASQDALTRCLNRGAFVTLVDAYLRQVNGMLPVRCGLLVVDADHFKRVNDTLGHESGDQALRLIAERIQAVVRPNDLVGRVGGEEFAVLLSHVDTSQAAKIAERIRESVSSTPFAPLGTQIPLSVSVGGVSFSTPAPFSDLFRAADQRLYEAKRLGRNRVEFEPYLTT